MVTRCGNQTPPTTRYTCSQHIAYSSLDVMFFDNYTVCLCATKRALGLNELRIRTQSESKIDKSLNKQQQSGTISL